MAAPPDWSGASRARGRSPTKTRRSQRREPRAPPPTERSAADKLENLLTLDTLQIELGYGLVAGRHAQGRRSAGTRDGRAPQFRAGNGHVDSADSPAGQSAIGHERIPLSAQGQSRRAGPAHARPLAGHERHEQQNHAQRHSDRRTGLSTAGHVDHGRRTQNGRSRAATPWWMRPRCWSRTCPKPSAGIATKFSRRQDVQVLLDNLKQTHPAVVNELDPRPTQRRPGAAHSAEPARRGHFHPQPRRHPGKSRAITRRSPRTRTSFPNTPAARLGPQITKPYQSENGYLRAITHRPAAGTAIGAGRAPVAHRGRPRRRTQAGAARHGNAFEIRSADAFRRPAAGGAVCAPIAPGLPPVLRIHLQPISPCLSYAEFRPAVQVQNAAVIPCLE